MRNGPGCSGGATGAARWVVVDGAGRSASPDREQPVRATAAMRAPTRGIRRLRQSCRMVTATTSSCFGLPASSVRTRRPDSSADGGRRRADCHWQGSSAATLLLHTVVNTAMDPPLAGRALGRAQPLSAPPRSAGCHDEISEPSASFPPHTSSPSSRTRRWSGLPPRADRLPAPGPLCEAPTLPPPSQLVLSRTRPKSTLRTKLHDRVLRPGFMSHLLDYAGPHTTQHQPSRLAPSAPLEPDLACIAGPSVGHSTRPYCSRTRPH
jgi:hypothetical protein